MSINANTIVDELSKVSLSEKSEKNLYEKNFHYHLNRLITIDLSSNEGVSSIDRYNSFDFRKYRGLEQGAFEDSHSLENKSPVEIQWGIIDEKTEIWVNHLKRNILSLDGNSDYLKPFIGYSRDQVNSYLIYESMYPETIFNPWLPSMYILLNGVVPYVPQNNDECKEYNKRIAIKNTENELTILAKSRKKEIAGFHIDKRYKIQMKVLDYLKEFAGGHKNLKPLKKIQDYLSGIGMKYSYNQIQQNITTPLKKYGLIGSNSDGFFFIISKEDILESCRFHRTKIISINRIMEVYQRKAEKFIGFNLRSECNTEADR